MLMLSARFGNMGAWKGLKVFKGIIVAWLIVHLDTYYIVS